MTTEEYAAVTERKLIDSFLETFYKKMGYYPKVITKDSTEMTSHLNILSLEILEEYFQPYLPTYYGKVTKISSRSRKKELVYLRHMFCFMARAIGFSLNTIGKFLNNRDHATIIHSIQTFIALSETDLVYKNKYLTIENKIKLDGYYYNTSTMVRKYQASC